MLCFPKEYSVYGDVSSELHHLAILFHIFIYIYIYILYMYYTFSLVISDVMKGTLSVLRV
jgi:hypothetical protein